ncbi:MAG: flagellar protein FlaG [Sulfurimonadaceae bacterium]|jgi:flagellar protein FlaG|nr:flagellar protein FlaG [Sulfurimonadaceae bacterium]
MDGIANVARQQSQMHSLESQGRATQVQQQQQAPKADIVKEIQQESVPTEKINSKEQMDELVDKLNKAISPFNTNIKFGVDTDDIFFVSVIEAESNKMLRRFPAEKAMDFLPKMVELTGILFDSKG